MWVIICTWRMGVSNLKLTIISSTRDCTTFHDFISMLKEIKKEIIFTWHTKNAARRCRHCRAVMSSWAIKHFDFQKLAGEVDNHIWIYGYKAIEGFSAFQPRSCKNYVFSNLAQSVVWCVIYTVCRTEKIIFWWSKNPIWHCRSSWKLHFNSLWLNLV